METDVLIVGSGIAGLSTALYLAELQPDLFITILDKSPTEESNTRYAQGGMAAVFALETDSFEAHMEDTLAAGKNHSDPSAVKKVVWGAPGTIGDLERWGVEFDRAPDGRYDLGLEGGHAYHRIVHHKDTTGNEIHLKLLKKARQHTYIRRITQTMGEDLLITEREGIRHCYGVRVFDETAQESYTITAKVVVLATGGSGQLFLQTTNPEVATGDGLAMAIRAGAAVRDLQYIQFHPTAIYDDSAKRNLLISEALRGAGAYILNRQLQRFLLRETPRGELATRDVVSSLMLAEMKKTGTPYLFLDARHLGKNKLSKNFPQVFNNCKMRGYDLRKDLVPIVPAAHYQCGGIRVDHQGKSTVEYLYAVGECAATGLHGTNRLASNSLTEAMVFAKEIACDIVRNLNRSDKEAPEIKTDGPVSIDKTPVGDGEWTDQTLRKLKTLMTELFVNPENESFRSGKYHHWITSCQNEVSGLIARGSVSVETLELHNLLTVGEALSKAIQEENVKHYKNIHI